MKQNSIMLLLKEGTMFKKVCFSIRWYILVYKLVYILVYGVLNVQCLSAQNEFNVPMQQTKCPHVADEMSPCSRWWVYLCPLVVTHEK